MRYNDFQVVERKTSLNEANLLRALCMTPKGLSVGIHSVNAYRCFSSDVSSKQVGNTSCGISSLQNKTFKENVRGERSKSNIRNNTKLIHVAYSLSHHTTTIRCYVNYFFLSSMNSKLSTIVWFIIWIQV